LDLCLTGIPKFSMFFEFQNLIAFLELTGS
jgi:hypothetical protein